MKKYKWSDIKYDKNTLSDNRKRFFAADSVALCILHSGMMVVLLTLGQDKWAIVNEGSVIGYTLLILLTPDVISKEIARSPFYYGGFVMPAVYGTMVGLLL